MSLCINASHRDMVCLFLATLLVHETFAALSPENFLVPLHSTFISSNSLTHKVWHYQPITSDGSKRSVLNYSFWMSNNACRLLFRVGETHWIIHGQDSLSFEERHGASDVCESLISIQKPSVTPELTLAITTVATWVAQKATGTRVVSLSAGLLHKMRVSRKDYRELAVPCLSSPSVCLQYTMCHAVLGGCKCIKKIRLLFHNELFCFSPEVHFCVGTLAMSIALKRLS